MAQSLRAAMAAAGSRVKTARLAVKINASQRARNNGACSVLCSAGESRCANKCVKTLTDKKHCGTCNNNCGNGTCAAGVCAGKGN
jgi:hypothetical protein